MATIDAGTVEFTSNIAVGSGHHVATNDTTRSHVSDRRKPVAVRVSSGTNTFNPTTPKPTAPDFDLKPANTAASFSQLIDYTQYNVTTNLYVAHDYFEQEDAFMVTDNQFRMPVALYETNPSSQSRLSLIFDFCDYIQRSGTVTYRIDCENTNPTSDAFIHCRTAGGSELNNPQTYGEQVPAGQRVTVEITDTFDMTVTGNDRDGFLKPSISWGPEVDHDLLIYGMTAEITCTGRTRVNSSEIIVTDFEIREDIVGPSQESDYAIRFTGFDKGTIIGGNPGIYSFVTKLGVNNVDQNSTATGQAVGIAKHVFPQTLSPDLVFRHSNTDITTSAFPHVAYNSALGGAMTEKQTIASTPGGAYLDLAGARESNALTDLPQVLVHNHINTDAEITESRAANLDIELRNIHKPDGSLANVSSTWDTGFVSGRLILNLPFLSEDLDFNLNTDFAVEPQLRKQDPDTVSATVSTEFTSLGGIVQFATPAIALQTELTETSTVILQSNQPEIQFQTDLTVQENIFVKPAQDPEIQTQFQVTALGNQLHQPTVAVQTRFNSELAVQETGVIISNQAASTFAFALTVAPTVFSDPNPYRELVIDSGSRSYSVPTETRDYAVNTQTRRYLVPEQTRTHSVNQQTRVLEQKGYNRE